MFWNFLLLLLSSRTKWGVSLLHCYQQDKINVCDYMLYVHSDNISKWPLGTLQEQMAC